MVNINYSTQCLANTASCLCQIMKLHYFEYGVQREPPELFYATCSETFHCIYMEALVLEFPFNKALRPETLLKQTPTQVFSCEYCSIFKNNFFEEQLFLIMTIWLLFFRKFAKLSRRNQLF